MTDPDQDQPGRVVQCETVRDLIERSSTMTGPCSLVVCAVAENAAVLKLIATIDGEPVILVADAAWLAVLWRMRPGERRPVSIAGLTMALEAWSRTDRSVTVDRALP